MHKFLFDKAPFLQCHAATVETDSTGNIHVAFFAGTRESHPDTGIWSCSSSDGGDTWTEPFLLVKFNEQPHWNPVLFRDGGDLYLFFKYGYNTMLWTTLVCKVSGFPLKIHDTPRHVIKAVDGYINMPLKDVRVISKMEAREYFSRGPARSKPIILPDGTWVAPSSWESMRKAFYGNGMFRIKWTSFFDISKDKGETWSKTDHLEVNEWDVFTHGEDRGGIIQPTIWREPDGLLVSLFRSTFGHVYRSTSISNGATWSPPEAINIPNNNSGIDVVRHEDNTILAYNPVSGDWAGRSPISLARLGNSGSTLESTVDILSGEGSFAYPILSVHDGKLMGVYTWNRCGIVFFKTGFDDLSPGVLSVPNEMNDRNMARTLFNQGRRGPPNVT